MENKDQPPDRPTVSISQSEIFNARLQQIIDGINAQRINETLQSQKLAEQTQSGFERIELSLRRVVDEVNSNSKRIEDLEKSRAAHSDRVQKLVGDTSNADISNEKALADEIVARATLAAKVDALSVTQETQLAILSRLDKVASNPLVKTMAAMMATAVLTWLAAHGVNFK